MSRVDDFVSELQKTKTTSRKREWRPVLGQTLEYGDSGYVIVLQKDSKRGPYRLQDPDGRVVAEGDRLPQLKTYAEEQARYRDEFDPGTTELTDFSKFKEGA